MTIRLSQELHTTGLVQLLQLFQHLRCMHLQLFDTCSRQREGHLEEFTMLGNHLLQGSQCRHIRTFCNIRDATFVLVVIIVVMICTDIKETVTLQMDNLMYLEI